VSDLGDFRLDSAPGPEPRPTAPAWPLWVAAGLVVLLVVLGAYVWFSRRSHSASEQASARAEPSRASRAPTPPLGAAGEPIELPPLGESDALVRELVGRLSAHPSVVAWLAGDGLIRKATVTVQNVAAGQAPLRQAQRLAPKAPFAARGTAGELTVDPQSYERYNWIADGVSSLDAQGVARLYGTLKPRVEEAYAELGSPESRFDATLERAIVLLLETPIVEGDVRLVPRGALYAYADPRLEGLAPGQKQLLRTGPRNTRVILAKLRDVALALGITNDRLPAPVVVRAR
jgi:Protein of unknown function (DUF3014)